MDERCELSNEDLQDWRRRMGLTQAQLAERLGTSQQTVHRWETGFVAIKHPRMMRLALLALETAVLAHARPTATAHQ